MTPRNVNSVVLGRRRMEYAVRYSAKARKCRIRVSPAGIEVVLPEGASQERAASFLLQNASWVLAQLNSLRRMGSIRAVHYGSDVVLMRGRQKRLEIVYEGSHRRYGIVQPDVDHLRIRVPKSNQVDPMRTLENWLRRQARLDIEERIAQRSGEMRQRAGRVYIMGQKTKWGNCSGRRNLSFNWRLVMAPPEVLDYLVVHELAHLIEPTHSTRFWLIVRSYCPDYARHKAWLRDHEVSLHRPVLSLLGCTPPVDPSSGRGSRTIAGSKCTRSSRIAKATS